MDFNIQQLEYIVALDNYRSFSKAAEHCSVTQPTLSMQVKKMEEELSVSIFDRSKKPLLPTSIGEKIIEQARIILTEVSELKELVQDSDVIRGNLTVGIIPTLAPYLIPLFAGHLLKNYPELYIRFRELQTDEIVGGIRKEEIDLGILATPLEMNGIREYPIFYEKMLCYVNPDLIEEYPNRITLSEMLNHKMWLLSQGNCFRNQVFNLCAIDQIAYKELSLQYESGSIEALMRLVDIEGGLTLVPELATIGLPGEKLDQLKFIDDQSPVREISVVLGRKTLKRNLVDVMVNEIMTALPPQVLENASENVVNIN